MRCTSNAFPRLASGRREQLGGALRARPWINCVKKSIYYYQFRFSYYEATPGNSEPVARTSGRTRERGMRAGVASTVPLTQAGAAQRSRAQRSEAAFTRIDVQE